MLGALLDLLPYILIPPSFPSIPSAPNRDHLSLHLLQPLLLRPPSLSERYAYPHHITHHAAARLQAQAATEARIHHEQFAEHDALHGR